MSGYQFLAAMCVETACILNKINTPLATRLTTDLTATDTARRPYLIDSSRSVMFGVRTTNSKVSQQWNDGYDTVTYTVTFSTILMVTGK